jgi:hypothetical protein
LNQCFHHVFLLTYRSSKTKDKSTSTAAAVSPTPTPTVILSTLVNVPPNFPVGTYSLYTFLDTVSIDCTSDPATWTCNPNVIYNTNPIDALSTFEMTISGSSGSYRMAPAGTDGVMNGLTFSSTPLQLLDAGSSSERYHFQVSFDRSVSTTLGGSQATCSYTGASFQGDLYTKTAKSYPAPGQSLPATSNQLWPFGMKLEIDASGGSGTPNCIATGGSANITDGLVAQPAQNSCSCQYRNWNTPT